MTTVGRHVEFTAQPEKGDELAAELTAVAAEMQGVAGCEQYAVGRVEGRPDTVAVVERWRTAELRDAAAAGADQDPRFPTIIGLLAPDVPPRVTDFDLAPGVGVLPPAREGFTHRNLLDSENVASAFGVEGMEARFPGGDLGLERTGLAHHRLPAGARAPFGHRHVEAEEVYVVLSGSGRARIDDAYVDLRPLDVLRIGPASVRAFEAGDEGLDVLAVGPRTPGDGELLHGWWKD
ncbi:MAG: antibiotic biosynthesis monooxygenase [Patulibacter sp.]|nr:antibiotic biosynthesis monooxygenase [Patulibacter sp.]